MSFEIEELRAEPNAYKRASTNKIVGRESYKGVSPGTLKLRVYYRAGCLNVHLGKAKLHGKRSQDPYALVYLLDTYSESCYFQKNNRQTDVFEKTCEPNFNKTFYFKMDLSLIKQKCLVVAVWDRDTKNHDDFMAGISVGLQQVQSFDDAEVQVRLNHQDLNGHPSLLDGNVEEKLEERAKYRADRGTKILGQEKYESHGNLKFKINYFWGFLHVHLESAELHGKRSQNPYALVYLLGSNGLAKFQIENNGTKTHDKNIKPQMNHDFFFKVNIDDVRRRDLVIAFWDADSNSHDDYMEGVKIIKYLLHLHHILIQIRFSLKDLVYFQKLDKIVKVELRHQHRDGHPAAISEREINSYFQVFIQDPAKMDLKSCNNKLVSFIEKARVLAEALDVKTSLPGHLAEKTTVEVQVEEMQALFRQEIQALTERIRDTRQTHKSRAAYRSELEGENKRARAEIEANLGQLRADQNNLNNLDLALTELSGKTSNLDYLRNQIEALEGKIRLARSTLSKVSWRDFEDDLRRSESHFRESEQRRTSLNAMNLGISRRMSEKSEVYLKIKTEYEAKIKEILTEKRIFLRKNYEDFIRSLESQAHEIMVLYEEIVRAKFAAGPAHQLELEQVERGRKYGERILGLESDIREVEGRLQQLDRMLAGLATKYHPQITELDLALRKYKEDLARVLEEMCSSAMSRYDLTAELGIYGQLLTSEETRMRCEKTEALRVTVRDAVSRQSHRTSVLALDQEISSSSSSSSHTRRESGYFSPESRSRSRTPETFLDNSEASVSDIRSGGSRHFHNIRDDVFTG